MTTSKSRHYISHLTPQKFATDTCSFPSPHVVLVHAVFHVMIHLLVFSPFSSLRDSTAMLLRLSSKNSAGGIACAEGTCGNDLCPSVHGEAVIRLSMSPPCMSHKFSVSLHPEGHNERSSDQMQRLGTERDGHRQRQATFKDRRNALSR